jgi:protein-L-isoaspartate(D-aspartate) O-methyltransferase
VQGRKVAGQIALQPLAEIGIPVLAEFAAPRSWSF